jgi:hypothetical protein
VSNTQEAPFSINITPGRPPQVTVRGINLTDWQSNLEEFGNHPDVPDAIAKFVEQVHVGYAAAELTQPTASAPASEPVVKAAQATAGNVPDMFQFTDNKNAHWTFQHPSAPDLPDGRPYKYAIREGVNANGKAYKALFDPATCYPQPPQFRFEKGADEIKPIWKHAVLG